MSLSLRCGDIAGNCDFVAHGETEEEVLQKIKEHIKTFHGIFGLSNLINEVFRKLICEDVSS
jgi:predicted small metal-binding protein